MEGSDEKSVMPRIWARMAKTRAAEEEMMLGGHAKRTRFAERERGAKEDARLNEVQAASSMRAASSENNTKQLPSRKTYKKAP